MRIPLSYILYSTQASTLGAVGSISSVLENRLNGLDFMSTPQGQEPGYGEEAHGSRMGGGTLGGQNRLNSGSNPSDLYNSGAGGSGTGNVNTSMQPHELNGRIGTAVPPKKGARRCNLVNRKKS